MFASDRSGSETPIHDAHVRIDGPVEADA